MTNEPTYQDGRQNTFATRVAAGSHHAGAGQHRARSVAQKPDHESQVLAAHQITFNQHIVMENRKSDVHTLPASSEQKKEREPEPH